MAGQPSETDIRNGLQDAKDLWASTIEAKTKLRDFYRREYKVRYLKSDSRMLIEPFEYRSGVYDERIDAVVGLLHVPVKFSSQAKGLGIRTIEEAEKIEGWSNAIFGEIEHAQGQSFDIDLCQDVVNYGYSALAVYPDPRRWADYPDYDETKKAQEYNALLRKYGEMAPVPICIHHIPALSWRPLLAGRIVLRSFQVQEVTAAELSFRYPQLKLPKSTKGTELLEYVTYIDDTWVMYVVLKGSGKTGGGGFTTVAKAWRHHMPTPKGQAPVQLYEGITTGDSELQWRWKGYGESVTDSVVAQDMIISNQATRAALGAPVTMDLEWEQAMGAATPEVLDMLNKAPPYVIGGTNVTIPGAKWEERKFGEGNVTVSEYVFKKLQDRIDDMLPPVLRGHLDAGTVGWAYNLASENALFRPKIMAQNMATSDVGSLRLVFDCLKALENIAGGPITVYIRRKKDKGTEAIGLSGSDVEDYGALMRATREAKLPTDVLSNLDASQKAINQGMSTQYAWGELARVENVQEVMDQRMAEEIGKEPNFIAARRQRILKRMGALAETEEGLTPEEASQGGSVPPAAERLLLAMGGAPDALGGGIGPSEQMGGAELAPVPEVSAPSAPPPRLSRRNPRAGQRSQPGGPRRMPRAPQTGAQT